MKIPMKFNLLKRRRADLTPLDRTGHLSVRGDGLDCGLVLFQPRFL